MSALAEERPVRGALFPGDGVGGTMIGVDGCSPRYPLCGGGEGDEESAIEAFERSAPSSSTSRPSLSRTVPPARRACSKSSSVREVRRPAIPWVSFDPTGCRPVGNDDGGTGDRGDVCLKRDARVRDGGLATSPYEVKARHALDSLETPQ